MSGKPTAPGQRLDRWLWFARVVKSRTLAARVIEGGKVRVNRVRVVKPSHLLREGDVLTVTLRGKVLLLKVLAAGARRGPPSEARLLYERLDDDDGGRQASWGQSAGRRSVASRRGFWRRGSNGH